MNLLRQHQLFAKKSKCSFAQKEVEYLGHVISHHGVATDPLKIECMINWPVPTNVKALRGFLGLTGYYRRFIQGYGIISKPLTSLLKKDSFEWNEDAEKAFNHLKELMVSALVLAMPDFSQPFIVETDASGKGIGVVLMQGGKPISYLSKALAPKNLGLSTYEKEFLALLLVVTSYETGVLKKGGKICIGSHGGIREKILKALHDSALGGHSGIHGTYQRIKLLFYWPTMKMDVQEWVKRCEICQKAKHENNPYPGLLQPLPIPEQAWSCVSMDFIEGLPNSEGKDSILVVVDRLTKYSHFISLRHPYAATSIAKVFFDNIYKLHGLPVSIISDRDKVFTSRFWKELFTLSELEDEVFKVYPIAILGSRLVPRNNVGVPQVLIQWAHSTPELSLPRNYVVAAKFPNFDPWGQGSKKRGRNIVIQSENATLQSSRPIEGRNESRQIEGAKEIGANFKSEAHCDVVSSQLGRNARGEEIGDFGKVNCSRFAPSTNTWTVEK
ncbi:UNVERIFIED_CONTAM: Retrovirus-related Pol polyprotein from transposon [Sesamum indicum]